MLKLHSRLVCEAEKLLLAPLTLGEDDEEVS